MFRRIIVPVDLEHLDAVDRSIRVAADLASKWQSQIYLVGVTGTAPSDVAHNPQEFSEKLSALAATRSSQLGVQFETKAMISPDQVADIDDTLMKAVVEIGADLVVMASHVPGWIEHVFASRAGYLAAHATVSVFIVR